MSTDTLQLIRNQASDLQAKRVSITRRIEKAEDTLAEIDRRLSAYKIVLAEVTGEEISTETHNSTLIRAGGTRNRSGSLTGSVRDALSKVQSGQFDIDDIMAHIDSESGITPKKATKTTGRLIREGDGVLELNGSLIHVVKPGAGSKSAVYEKTVIGKDEPGQNTTHGGVGSELEIPRFNIPDPV